MKKSKVFFAASLLMTVAACTNKEEINGPGYGVGDATFSLKTVSVENTKVSLEASATGASGATYYGFLTEDLTTPVATLVKNKVSSISVTRHILSSGTTTFTEEGLRPGGKTYRYIMTGLLANGATYNDPLSVEFTTTGDFVDNSAGIISYPNPVSEPTTVKFEGFPGKYVYGMSENPNFGLADLKEVVNEALNTKNYKASEGDQSVALPISEEGTYIVYAYELDENNFPTLSCKLFTLTVSNLDFSAYEAFLGTWYVNGLEDFTLTFTEAVKGASYYVHGIPTTGLPSTTTYEDAIVDFDMASGSISFSEQDMSTFVISTYGDCMKVVTGVFNYGGTNYRYYPYNADEPTVLFTATIGPDGDMITETGECPYAPFVGFCYGWYILEGENAGRGNYSNDIVPLPISLTRNPAAPLDEYLDWIGSWYTEGGDPITIAADKTNDTYVVSGLTGDFDVITKFDPTDNSMYFFGQQVGEDDSYDYFFYGRDQDNYIEPGAQDGTSKLAIATLSSDKKSISIVGNEYIAVYGSTEYEEIIVSLGVWAIAGTSIYGTGIEAPLPMTWTKDLPTPTEEYLSWVGNWNVFRAERTATTDAIIDTWTIAPNKVNSSYIVTGIEGTAFPVEGKFDRETNAFSIAEQEVYSLADDNDNNVLTVTLYGNFNYEGESYYWGEFNEPDLFHATIGEDGNATMEAGCPYAPYIQYYGYFTAFRLYAFLGDADSPYVYSPQPTPLPNVMTKVSDAETNAVLPLSANQWRAAGEKRVENRGVNSSKKEIKLHGSAPSSSDAVSGRVR